MGELKQFFEKKYYPVFQGAWNDKKGYVALDTVEYNNARYIAKIPVPAGTLPTETAYWLKYIGSTNDWQDILNKLNNLENTVISQGTKITALENKVVSLETDIENINNDMRNLIAMLIGE